MPFLVEWQWNKELFKDDGFYTIFMIEKYFFYEYSVFQIPCIILKIIRYLGSSNFFFNSTQL